MKKTVLALVVLSLLISAQAFAAETQKNEMPGMDKRCCPLMGKAQMVATDEGGVFILAGNKLTKYDADLNVVKEIEIKMPMPGMGGKQCPMMGKAVDQGPVGSPGKKS